MDAATWPGIIGVVERGTESPSVLGAVMALSRGIGAGIGHKAREHASCKRQVESAGQSQLVIRCRIEPQRIKAAPAAPAARRQRRTQPLEGPPGARGATQAGRLINLSSTSRRAIAPAAVLLRGMARSAAVRASEKRAA
jgi:hypothetical protein